MARNAITAGQRAESYVQSEVIAEGGSNHIAGILAVTLVRRGKEERLLVRYDRNVLRTGEEVAEVQERIFNIVHRRVRVELVDSDETSRGPFEGHNAHSNRAVVM